MAQYNAIKAAVNAYIKANGRKEITGQILNSVLNASIDSLGKYFQFAGEARPDTDPGTPDQNVTYLAGTAGTYTEFGGITLDPQEIALLMWDGEWVKHTMLIGIKEVSASVDDQVGTPSVDVNYNDARLSLEFHNIKGVPGNQGEAAGFGSVTADVDSNVGTPGVSVETSGTNTAKNFTFHFTNLKGDVGIEQVNATIDNNTGVPYVTATLSGQVLTLAFHNMKGQQGDTGSSVSFPFTLANNVTTDDATQGLSAAMGVCLYAEINQTNNSVKPVIDAYTKKNVVDLTALALRNYSIKTDGTYGGTPTYKHCLVDVQPGVVVFVAANSSAFTRVAFVKSTNSPVANSAIDLCVGQSCVELPAGASQTFIAPPDAVGCLVYRGQSPYPSTPDIVQISTAIVPVDSLDSTDASAPLSANQGRVLNEDINGVTSPTYTDQEIIPDKYFNTQNSRIPDKPMLADATTTSVVYVFVTPGETYRIYGKGNGDTHQLYALGDADRYVVENGTPGVALNTRVTPLDLTIPEGVAILVVNLYQYDSTTDKVQKVGSSTTECVKTRLNALEAKDAELETIALPLKGKKGIFFGDSITYLSYNGKGVVSYFNECAGVSFKKAAVGGARFVQRAVPTDTPTTNAYAYAALDICNMVKAWCDADYTKQDAAVTYLNEHSAPYDYTSSVNAMKSLPIADADFVLIGGGTNDMSNNSPIGTDTDNDFTTIKGSINKMIELLLTANPKLKIYFYSPVVGYHGEGGRTDANWDDNHQFSSGLTKPEYIDIFADRARKNHIPYINLYWTLGWNQVNFSQYYLDTDDHHPYKGFDVIGRRLYRQVVTNLE